jgi:5-methyltetrahydrofolate corrinoid/iron sulfur protein methyltransferase
VIPVADNLQILRPSIQRAVDRRDPEPIAALVRRLEAAGAEAIDINAGPCARAPAAIASFLVSAVEQSCGLPILIDTANPEAMAAGLAACRRRPILNGFSLEPRKLEKILPLAAEADVDIVGYLLDADGHVPPDAPERLAAALSLFEAAAARGLSPERIIVDPIVVPLSWQDGTGQVQAVLEVLRMLPDLLGRPVRTVAGLSNLTAGAPPGAPRQRVESVFLSMMAAAGLSMVLLDAFRTNTMQTAAACRALVSGEVFSWASLDRENPGGADDIAG